MKSPKLSKSMWKESAINPRLFDKYPYVNSTNIKVMFMRKKIPIFLDS
jgi:hypothetical protein